MLTPVLIRAGVGFAVSILLAALFHKTALLMLPIAALASTQRRIWTAVWIAILFTGGFNLLLEAASVTGNPEALNDVASCFMEGHGEYFVDGFEPAHFKRRSRGHDEPRRSFRWIALA